MIGRKFARLCGRVRRMIMKQSRFGMGSVGPRLHLVGWDILCRPAEGQPVLGRHTLQPGMSVASRDVAQYSCAGTMCEVRDDLRLYRPVIIVILNGLPPLYLPVPERGVIYELAWP